MKMPARRRATGDPIKGATIAALNRAIEPLIELMLDAGVTIHEFNKLVRERAVRVAMKRLMKEGSKESKSRAAIMTGLPRSEVTKILRSSDKMPLAKSDQLPARRILAAWNDDPRFSTANGNPAVLPIFGRTVSFEQLVDRYGGGIPVRAMLDELTQMQAVERLAKQRVKVQDRVYTFAGLTQTSIADIGERCSNLLQTLAHNRHQSSEPFFQQTAVSDKVDFAVIPVVHQEISEEAKQFFEKIGTVLELAERKRNVTHSKAEPSCRIGITVYFFNDLECGGDNENGSRITRKNLRRQTCRNSKKSLL